MEGEFSVRRMTSWLLSALLVAAMSTTVSAQLPDEWKYLDVQEVTQANTNWCWAGSSLSILNYYRIYTSQCTFVTYVKTGKTTGTCDNLQATDAEAQKGLNYFGVSSTSHSGALSWSATRSELDNNRPIYAHIRWLDSDNQDDGGHAVVVDGYYYYPNDAYQEIRYMDPWTGAFKTKTYSGFVRTSYDQYWTSGLRNLIKKPLFCSTVRQTAASGFYVNI